VQYKCTAKESARCSPAHRVPETEERLIALEPEKKDVGAIHEFVIIPWATAKDEELE
jgi:hypothetical protein